MEKAVVGLAISTPAMVDHVFGKVECVNESHPFAKLLGYIAVSTSDFQQPGPAVDILEYELKLEIALDGVIDIDFGSVNSTLGPLVPMLVGV
jgi:hypothetical protein